MKKLILVAGLANIALLPVVARTTASTPQTSNADATGETSTPHSWTTEQIITSSVREAWALGGKTEDGFFAIVKALAEISAQKRGVTLPDTKEAGVKAGNWIKKQAKKDPDQLLYVIVDQAVQYTGAHQKSANAP